MSYEMLAESVDGLKRKSPVVSGEISSLGSSPEVEVDVGRHSLEGVTKLHVVRIVN
jgi:hypothetical protein